MEALGIFNQSPVSIDKLQVLPMAPRSRIAASLYVRYGWRRLLQRRLQGTLHQYDLLIVSHINLAPSVYSAWLQCKKRPPYWMCAYGVEAWGSFTRLQIQALKNAKCIISISNYTADKIRERLFKSLRIFVVPNPVDTNMFIPPSISVINDKKILLTVSRISSNERYKGHEIVIQALPLIEDKLKTPVLYKVVGSGDDVGYLRSLAAQVGVKDRVRFVGYLPHLSIPLIEAYQNCDVFVMPSRVERCKNGRWTGEGFGNVYIEAAACSKPVIASNQGGAAEAILDGVTGFAVDPTSPEAVAEAAYKLLSDSTLASQMGQAGRKFVSENFSTQVFQHRVSRLLGENGF